MWLESFCRFYANEVTETDRWRPTDIRRTDGQTQINSPSARKAEGKIRKYSVRHMLNSLLIGELGVQLHRVY